MEIVVNWEPSFDSNDLNEEVKKAIADKMIADYMDNIEESFTKKMEELILTEAQKIVHGMSKIYVDKCNTSGVKESMTIEQFIIQTATDSLTNRVDRNGRSGHNASGDRRTPIEWFITDTIDGGKNNFGSELKTQCVKIERDYAASLEAMVNKTLAPLYKKLREQVKV